ncbi:MAG: 30S ribosomal protein S17 [Patescibacteria group bacterium]|nr:30S ribosomal protein S17 [Patescibacteria group bacterium]
MQTAKVLLSNKKTKIRGKVVSDKMDKTIVIMVNRLKQHPRYLKVFKVSRKIKVHDEKNIAKIGDLVEAIASRPISRDKSFTLAKILNSKHD